MQTPTTLDPRTTSPRALSAEVRSRLGALYQRIATRLPGIADGIVETTNVSSDRCERERSRDLLVEWMRIGLVGADGTQHVIRTRIARRFAESGWLHGAAFAMLVLLRAEYRRCIVAMYERDEAWYVLVAVDKLLELEHAQLVSYHRNHHARRARDGDRGRLTERLAALRTLTAGLAHEVKNPLNSARLQLEVLERRLHRELADVRFSEPSARARDEITKLAHLLDELLAFASPPALQLVRYDVVTLVRDVVEAHREVADGRRITLVLSSPPVVVAELDACKLRTILHHLLVNAIEAIERDGAIRIVVHAHVDRVRIEVVDDGPGIPTEIRARVYEPFFSTKGSGTGLGMAIVHTMVALHGGSIEIESEPGNTAVAISIPRRGR